MSQLKVFQAIDANSKPVVGTMVGVALAVTYNATLSSAVNVTLNANTSYFEVAAIAKGVFLRYQATASSANFDEFIPQDSIRGFAVPDGVTVISVIQQASSAAVAIVEK